MTTGQDSKEPASDGVRAADDPRTLEYAARLAKIPRLSDGYAVLSGADLTRALQREGTLPGFHEVLLRRVRIALGAFVDSCRGYMDTVRSLVANADISPAEGLEWLSEAHEAARSGVAFAADSVDPREFDFDRNLRDMVSSFLEFTKSIAKDIENTYIVSKLALEELIDEQAQDYSQIDPKTRCRMVEDFARKNGWEGVAAYVGELFSDMVPRGVAAVPEESGQQQAAVLPLPTSAPKTWKDDKHPGESAPNFIRRVYGDWLGNGLA